MTVLRGWRQRAWAWVLFVALLKGLIPHTALAAVVMSGSPQLMWCAPGATGATQGGKAAAQQASAHGCVCATAGDGVLPFKAPAAAQPPEPDPTTDTAAPAQHIALRVLPPPARGPPMTL